MFRQFLRISLTTRLHELDEREAFRVDIAIILAAFINANLSSFRLRSLIAVRALANQIIGRVGVAVRRYEDASVNCLLQHGHCAIEQRAFHSVNAIFYLP